MKKRHNKMTLEARRRSVWVGLFLALILGITACSDDAGQNGQDATGGWDVGSDDAGEVDASHDTGLDDVGVVDAGGDTHVDDVGVVDAGGDTELDDTGDIESDADAASPGRVAASPNPVSFGILQVGDETTVDVEVSNIGGSPLRITRVSLLEDLDDTNEEFFADGDGWGSQDLSLSPGDTHVVTVRYAPEDDVVDTGSIRIDSDDPNNAQFSVPIITQESLAPAIYSPTPISFASVTPPTPSDPSWQGDWRMTQVWNTGAAPLQIEDIRIAATDSPFRFSIPQPTDAEIAQGLPPSPNNDTMDWPASLQPNKMFDVRVWFAPQDTDPKVDTLIVESNDPSNPEYSVNLFGNSVSRCIEVNPSDEVDFGLSSIGQTSQKTIRVKNCATNSTLDLQEIEITDDGGGVFAIENGSLPSGLPADAFVLDAGEQANFVVTFSPTTQANYNGSVRIKSNDASQAVLDLPLLGEGINNVCPTARAVASIQGDSTAIPSDPILAQALDTIEFDAGASSDPDGSVARYEWTLLSSPAASSEQLQPADGETPTLFLDVSGEYRVELKVYDNENTVSCGEPAIININAYSGDDISIQLTWEPQGDVQDTDLDLHYLHPNGTQWGYDSGGWDCHYGNRTPDWGVPNGSPAMIIDDLTGPGPEVITQSNLEDLLYKVGVHYYGDHGNGPAYATVEVRRYGVLIFSQEDKFLSDKQFWLVGTIDGADLTVEPIDTVAQELPQ